MIMNQQPPWNMMMFCLGLSILFILLGTSCNHPNMPPIDVTFWAGDSVNAGVTRKQDHATIPAIDPRFDTMACLSYLDLQKIYSTLLTCKDWGSQPTSHMQAFERKNIEVIHHVRHAHPHR